MHGVSLVANIEVHGLLIAVALGTWASVVAARGLRSCGAQPSVVAVHRLSGPWAYWPRGRWGLPGPGLEPWSPALAGGFLTTAPPGKPLTEYI